MKETKEIMRGLGTIVNVAAVAAGSGIGLILKGGIPARMRTIITQGMGLCVVLIGLTGALSGMMKVTNGTLVSKDTLVLVASIVLGCILGEGINIEKRMEGLCARIEGRFGGKKDGSFTEAAISSSLLFCVGAMAIVGSLQDGLSGDHTMLFTKAVMDGVMAIVFSSALGIGTLFSVVPLLVYQGGITLLASVLSGFLSNLMITRLSLAGSVLIFALGLNMVLGTKIKVGNMLPAVLLPVLITALGF